MPDVYDICNDKDILVKNGREKKIMNLDFRRWLYDADRASCDSILDKLQDFEFTNDSDLVFWKWEKKKKPFR